MLSVGEPCHELLGLFLVGAQLEGGNELAAGHGGLDLALGVAYGHPLKVLDVLAVAVDVPAAADMGRRDAGLEQLVGLFAAHPHGLGNQLLIMHALE